MPGAAPRRPPPIFGPTSICTDTSFSSFPSLLTLKKRDDNLYLKRIHEC